MDRSGDESGQGRRDPARYGRLVGPGSIRMSPGNKRADVSFLLVKNGPTEYYVRFNPFY